MSDLLPCPFCGGEAREEQSNRGDWFLRCSSCCSSGGHYRETDKAKAIAAWNCRAPAQDKEG